MIPLAAATPRDATAFPAPGPPGPATAAATAEPLAADQTEGSASALTSDFETFLKMLTTQLRNQDPLDPMKSDQFALQLATFSGVEQQVLTNDLLTGLSQSLGTAGMAELAGWVGMEVKGSFPVKFDGAPVTLYPRIPAVADKAEIVVRNAAGAEVQRLPLPLGDDPVVWAGAGPAGDPLPPGHYDFELVSSAGGEELGRSPVERYGIVEEARRDGGTVLLKLADGSEVPVDTISAVRDPGGTDN